MAFLASQLAVAAATTLAKKTFEFSIVQSLNGLSDVIRKRFSTSRALQDAQVGAAAVALSPRCSVTPLLPFLLLTVLLPRKVSVYLI
jgi:hypothetical protein